MVEYKSNAEGLAKERPAHGILSKLGQVTSGINEDVD
jgi:hypothetical protein